MHASLGMSDPELIEMMDVSDAEVQRRQEDDLLAGELGQNMERDDERSPDKLFARRTHNVVPIAYPTAEGLYHISTSDPILPAPIDDAGLEEWACK